MARDRRIRGVKRALRRIHRVARLVVRGARRLEARFQIPQLGILGFQRIGYLFNFMRMALALGRRIAPAQEPQQVLLELQVGVVFPVARGHLGLRFELFELRAELEPDVADARQVVARVGEAVLGFPPALLVFRDPRSLLEKYAQLVRLGLDHPRDHALLDNGVGARAEAGAEEHVGDVAPAHVHAVDVVARLAVALQDALHRDLGVLRPLPGGAAQRVVEHQLDRGARHRRAVDRAVEDDVLHRVAAQRRGARLAEHPAHRVDHVRFAAAVRADHADQLARHMDRSWIDEGLEA